MMSLPLVVMILVGSVGQSPAPPVASVVPKADTLFGDVRVDNYYWMRDRGNPEVIAYLEEENTYTEAVMDHTKDLQEELYQEMKGRIKETDLSVPVRRGDYYYYTRDVEGKQYKIHCRKEGLLDAEEEILLDVNQLAEGKEFLDLGTFEVSPNHTILAYGTDDKGSERYDIVFLNLRTRELYSETIEQASGTLAWANDNRTVFYTMPDSTWRTYRLYRHVLGTDPSTDGMVFEERDERFWLDVFRTKNGRYLILESASKLTCENYFLDADDPGGNFRLIRPRKQGVEYYVSHHDNRFFIRTNENAINFKVVTAPTDHPDRWSERIGHRDNFTISNMDLFKDHMVVWGRRGGFRTVEVTRFSSGETHTIELPEPVSSVYAGDNPEFDTELLRFSYESMVTPETVYDYDMNTREWELKKKREVLGGYDPTRYRSERIYATANDGARVPISLVYRSDVKKDSGNPVYLYGYGSYGYALDPYFSSDMVSLLDRGVIYAIAHVRGGGEMGEKWYHDGRLLKKINTFTDFIACAKYLIDHGYTNRDKLVIRGGSAGGLLIGAVVNMRPDLFHTAVAAVPFVDVINTMLDASIPLTVTEYEEWGNPNEEQYYRYMKSYSPYDNVASQPYPDLLILSSLNDTRVGYWEGAKWAAKLRAHHKGNGRLLLKTNMGAGHGGWSGRYDYLREKAFTFAFVLDSLGITN